MLQMMTARDYVVSRLNFANFKGRNLNKVSGGISRLILVCKLFFLFFGPSTPPSPYNRDRLIFE